ncbi:PAS domain-containing protein [Rhodohalobacter sulfatireducens]|uniref:histidine kinase n=1 Tax=Rhodohalobacter sulfatireducens TaxID=2911366 RepID=A0ABS9KFD6_9BACT|nr:PAS domain-containing protein [Rhodohalobacter sulfatireducens]MCG2589553.1 PAS domain-containing protein [Rhodohalobacter sulfatireducens]
MKFTPLRITFIYIGIALLWITTTDQLVESMVEGEELITRIQIIKGYFYVLATGLFLYWMVKSHEETLKREQELQRRIIETIPVMITVYRPDLSEISVNNEFENVTGWSNQEINSINVMDKIYPDQDYQKQVREFMDKSNAGWKDFKMVTKNGEEIQSTWTNIKLSDETQIGIGLDITERKKIEQEFKKNQEWLHITTTSSNVGLWEWHPQTGKAVLDEVWANLVGYTLDELQPISIETWNGLLHPDDLHKFENEIARYFSGETPIYESEVRMKHKDGHWVWILDRGRAVEWDDEGYPTKLVGTHVDITNQKNIEQRINAERQRFEIASNLTSDVIWEWKPYTNQLWWGEGIETVFGYAPKDYKGDPDFWKTHIAQHDRERVYNSMKKAEKSGDLQWNEEYEFIAADGTLRKIKDSAVIIRNDDGSIRRIIGAMVDQTKEIEYQEALRHQSHRFEMIAKSSNDVLYEWNMKTNHVWWSEGWQARFNYPEDTVPPTYEWWESNIHPEDREKIINSLKKVLESQSEYWTSYYRFKNGDGSYSHVVDRGYFLKRDHDEYEYMVGTISDITADVIAKEELKASEEQYRLLFKQNPIPMFIYDPDSLQFTTVNEAAIQKYGYKEEEMIGLSIFDIRPKSEVEYLKKVLNEYSDKHRASFHETIHQTKNGKKIIVEISSSNILYKGKKQRLVIANDITDQREAEERAISAIIEGEERERQRIAKELHDGLGQYLSASNMNLKSVYEDIGEIPDELKSTFEAGLRFLNHAISETRSISQNLLPKAIQDYGLELAAESLTNQLRKLHNIDVYFYSNLNDVELSDKVQINLYRILQEALNNATRHANPTKIEVQLVYSEGEVLMTIEDNGVGFDINKAGENGLGIRSIKTRVGAMSANLDIVSNKDRGTIVSVVVPIH